MKRTLLLCALLLGSFSFSQTQLYSNTFEGAPGFNLNTTDEGGTATGVNPWVVNNDYAGGAGTFLCLSIPIGFTVPAADTQPTGITNSPTSQYLHVTPQIAIDAGIPTASYLVHDAICTFGGESTFAAMTTDFSTVGYDSISIDLWWMCGGHFDGGFSDYYGEVYYSTDGGSNWTSLVCPSTGNNEWRGETQWVNQALTDANLAGQAALRLGFRFYMGVTTTGSFDDPGFAIDDITVTGYNLCSETTSSITESACDQYISPSGNYTWTSTGMYNDTIPNMAGCDSVITVDLTITTVDNNVTAGTMSLSADASGGGVTYQWLDCNNSYAVIAGATAQVYDAMNGDFAVEVTDNGCVDTSACNSIAGLSIGENPLDGLVRVYPNPTAGDFFIEISDLLADYEIKITNVEGKVVQRKTGSNEGIIELNLAGESGIYFVEVSFGEGELKQTYRLVKM